MVFLQPYEIIQGGCLRETENKRICQNLFCALKGGRGRLRNLSCGRLLESF